MRIILLLSVLFSRLTFAAAEKSIFEGSNCIGWSDIRRGNISFDKIPCIIISVADTLLSFVGYISLGVILLGALMYIFGGVNEEFKSTGKSAIKFAIIGAMISWSSWIIVNFVIDNL